MPYRHSLKKETLSDKLKQILENNKTIRPKIIAQLVHNYLYYFSRHLIEEVEKSNNNQFLLKFNDVIEFNLKKEFRFQIEQINVYSITKDEMMPKIFEWLDENGFVNVAVEQERVTFSLYESESPKDEEEYNG